MPLMSLKKVAAWAAIAVAASSATSLAQTATPVPLRKAEWPVVTPAQQAAQPDEAWTKAEVEAAKARCKVVAAQYNAVFEPVDLSDEGGCGTPYPVRLTRLGKLTLSQPATLNCEMVATVGDWMTKDVQPAARKYLGERVTGIDVLSSYSCRNAYGRKRGRLSEHARANALDIRGFKMERDSDVEVIADWGMTARDIKAKIAAAEKAARKLADAAAVEAKSKAAKATATSHTRQIAANVAPAEPAQPYITAAAPSLAEQQARQQGIGLIPSADGLTAFRGFLSTTLKGTSDDSSTGSILSWQQPSRLGGPKPSDQGHAAKPRHKAKARAPEFDANGHNARQQFLRDVHDSACRRFGTSLGPEANEAHRNHLHVDLADRGSRGSYCR